MSESPDFTKMADKREEEAAILDDLQIYVTMVKSILENDAMPIDFRVNMLIEALGDVEIIRNAVKVSVDQDLISKDLGDSVLELLIE